MWRYDLADFKGTGLELVILLWVILNFNLLDLSNHNVDFLDFMMSNDLYPLVSVPTRIVGQSATLTDYISVHSADLKLC